jgi:hypothetical protein
MPKAERTCPGCGCLALRVVMARVDSHPASQGGS